MIECQKCHGDHFIRRSGAIVQCDCIKGTESKPGLITPLDAVNSPRHYVKGGMECQDAVKAAISNLSGYEALAIGSAIQYLWRYKEKNGVEDLKKARWYIDSVLEQLEK
jgi:hypothetical protein